MIYYLDGGQCIQHANWIGKSYGCEITFKTEGDLPVDEIKCFTTRPDTLFGFSFALSIDHEISKFYSKMRIFKDLKECQKTGIQSAAIGDKIGLGQI